jgi:hypothetical protein
MRAKGLATLEFYTEDMKYAEREKGDDATVGHLFFILWSCNQILFP